MVSKWAVALVACIGLGFVFVASAARLHALQVIPATSHQPFIVTRLHVFTDSRNGEIIRYQTLFGRNSSGSTVQVRAPVLSGIPGSRTVVDLEARVRVVIDPMTESLTTTKLPDAATLQRALEGQCRHTTEQQKIVKL